MSTADDNREKREHPWARAMGWAVASACLFALGWLARGWQPPVGGAGGPPGMMMGMPPGAPPLVGVATVAEEVLNPPASYIGLVEPIREVDLRPQVEGYIQAYHFEEGAAVSVGDLLFTIDPAPYEARVALREAELARAEAALEHAARHLKRLEASDERAVSQTNLDAARSEAAQGAAAVRQARANLALAAIDLKHTRVHAPIAGRVGRAQATLGDFVSPAIGPLARIVQTDPIRVVFSMTDREALAMRERRDGAMPAEAPRIRARLPTGTILEEIGVFDFEDNEMSAATATLAVRARFANPRGLLIPNGHVTALMDQADAPRAPVIPQAAVARTAAGPVAYVVGPGNVIESRLLETGVEEDGRIAVLAGLTPGERIVVEGIHRAIPGQPVTVPDREAAQP